MDNSKKVVVVDYGCGNLESIVNIVEHVGGEAETSDDAMVISRYNKIILPGVGHFEHGMKCLKNSGLIDVLNKRKNEGAHILGICLGMQLMTASSEEGGGKGLCWFDFETKRFPNITQDNKKIVVPHMGWNKTNLLDANSPLLENESRFYFVHSYYVDASEHENCLTVSEYEGIKFASGIKDGNVIGFQFHPEKSHKNGMFLFKEFLKL